MQGQNGTTLFFEVRQLNKSRKFDLHDLTMALVAAAFTAFTIFGACAMFGIDVMYLSVVLTSVITAFVLVPLWNISRAFIIKVIAAVLPAGAGLIMMKYAGNGAALIGNAVVAAIGADKRTILLPFSVTCSQSEQEFCITVTCCLLAVWLTLLAVHLLMDSNRITAIVFFGLLAVLNVMFGNISSWVWLLCSAVCTVLVLAKGFMDEKHEGDTRIPVTGAFLLVICVLLAAGAVLYSAVKPAEYERPGCFKELSGKITAGIEAKRYGDSENRALPFGNFESLEDLKFSDTVMLQLNMTEPESLYLRGFVGSQYNADGWTAEDGDTLYKYAETFYWLHKDGLFGQTQIAKAAQVLDSKAAQKTVSVTVENVAADSRYYYTPYEMTSLTAGGQEILNSSVLDDGSLPAGGWSGQRKYEFVSLENQVKRYPSLVAQLRDDENQNEEYLKNESHYNAFVYETYTKLPARTAELMANHLKNYGYSVAAGESHLNYTKAKEYILDYLNKEIKYSEEIQQRSEDTDFVTDFMEVSKSGYSVHYATAATLMFRYYGIPARYVEGYLVTPDAVKNAGSSGSISITDKQAHAWVEYYQDGIGWIPFEVTPPYMDVMEQPETLASSGSGGTSGQSSGAAMEMARDNYEPEEPESDDDKKTVPWKKVITAAGIAMILLLILAVIIRLVLRKRKLNALQQSFVLEDRDASVINLFVYILTLHDLLGTERAQNIYEIYQIASFSADPVSQEECSRVLEYKDGLLAQIKEQCSIAKRFKYRWIKGIY